MYLHNDFITLTLTALQHLSRMFHFVQNQLNAYTITLADVLSYATADLSSPAYMEPAPNASKHIMYPQLHEELKTIL